MTPPVWHTLHCWPSGGSKSDAPFDVAHFAPLAIQEHAASLHKTGPARGLLVNPGDLPAGVTVLCGLPVKGLRVVLPGHIGVY